MTEVLNERELREMENRAAGQDVPALVSHYRVLKYALRLATNRLIGLCCPPGMHRRGPGCRLAGPQGSDACADCHEEDIIRRTEEAITRAYL